MPCEHAIVWRPSRPFLEGWYVLGWDDAVLKCTHGAPPHQLSAFQERASAPYERSIPQYDAEERIVDFQAAVVLDEAEFSKLVHEEIHARARRADHLGQRFL
jgi:hypothetical protein